MFSKVELCLLMAKIIIKKLSIFVWISILYPRAEGVLKVNFMTVEQYQFIKKQAKKMLNTFITTKDQQVIRAMQAVVTDDINHKIGDMTIEQRNLLKPVLDIKSKEQMEQIVTDIKPFVEPFKKPAENEIKKLFSKDKKLKIPSLNQFDWQEISYLSWFDAGSNRKYIVYREDEVLKGVRGVFSHSKKRESVQSVTNSRR